MSLKGVMGRADSVAEFVVWDIVVNPEIAQGKGILKLKFLKHNKPATSPPNPFGLVI